jgi:hypothetical protein
MKDSDARPGPLQRAWHQALDGNRPWGSVEVRPDRFGVTRYRLTVYPPGVNQSERRRIRLARGWPLWGSAGWIVTEIWASQLCGPWIALVLSTTLAVGGGFVANAMAGAARRRVRTMRAAVMTGQCDPVSVTAVDTLQGLAIRLLQADDLLRDGRLSPVEHESIWWGVYDEMSDQPPVRRA